MARKAGQRPPITFSEACGQLSELLSGNARRAILEGLGAEPLTALRPAMRANSFGAGAADLRRIVQTFDQRSRQEGLHVMQGWDFQRLRFTDDSAPVLLLDYCNRLERRDAARTTAALLLDQYVLAILSLLSVRAWDEGDANANFDRLRELLDALNGPNGGGRRTVDDVETLFLLAISYFHPDERCYGLLLDKVLTLDEAHRLRMAVPWAVMMSGHLRWGFRFMYRSDVGAMRNDNVVDYPWLLFAVATLVRAHDPRNRARSEALLAGIAADPWAFSGPRPPALDGHAKSHAEASHWFKSNGKSLLAETVGLGAASAGYSPLALTSNFPSNAAVASVAVSVEDGATYPSLNALFASQPAGEPEHTSADRLAKRLAAYSIADPSRLGAHGAPLIVYDPHDGVRAYNNIARALRD